MRFRIFRPAQGVSWLEEVLRSIERLFMAVGEFGFFSGDGGAVTQATSKATTVTLDAKTGEITTHAAALAAGTIVSFTLTNARIAASDQIMASHHSGGTIGAYTINGRATAAGAAQITLRNNTGGSLSEAVVIKFSIIKAFTA
jgi:hypothetical protein